MIEVENYYFNLLTLIKPTLNKIKLNHYDEMIKHQGGGDNDTKNNNNDDNSDNNNQISSNEQVLPPEIIRLLLDNYNVYNIGLLSKSWYNEFKKLKRKKYHYILF